MSRIIAALASAALIFAPFTPAAAGNMGGYGNGGMNHGGNSPGCPNMGGHGGNVNIYKPININKNINVFKPVVINKNIDINKNININKNVIVNKNIVINKVNAFSSAEASAFASAAASAQVGGQTIVYSGSYSIVNNDNRGGGGTGAIAVTASSQCHTQEVTLVKAIHAMCVSVDGREFPASHMISDTWIDQSYEGEIARCIPGAHLKITIGDVLQSDQGLAGTYDHGAVLMCGAHEAVRQFKDGMLKCTPEIKVPDCTERTNLRRFGSGDMFFSYRSQVCVGGARAEADTGGMTLDGGVGDSSGY